MYHNHNGDTYPAWKPIPVAVLRRVDMRVSLGRDLTACQRRLIKRRHTRKSRRYLRAYRPELDEWPT